MNPITEQEKEFIRKQREEEYAETSPDISHRFYRCRAIRLIYCVALVRAPRHIV